MLSKCLDLLKREDFKHEVKQLCYPIVEMFADSIRLYLLYGVLFILLNFFLVLAILFYVMKIKKMLNSLYVQN